MRTTMKIALAAACGLFLVGAAPIASAQDQNIEDKIIASVEYESADVREALRALFRNVNVSYAIDPEVQGTVTVSLKSVPFGTALQHITRQVDSTYQVQGGVYRIMRRQPDINTIPAGGDTPSLGGGSNLVFRRIKISSADPMYIAAMIGAQGGAQDFSGPPERSTIINGGSMGGGQGGGGGMGGGGMGGGGFGGGQGGGGFGGGGGGMGGGGMGGGGGRGGGGGGFGGGGGGGGRGGFGG